ncbi:acyltransferase family protein [Kitasatospora sp. NPDC092948]|uniref:acyltransferase family protein n=1 Tax=Kitasatospora sp. NPDC092948 TaxID=3364088 RepID=UPI0037F80CE1
MTELIALRPAPVLRNARLPTLTGMRGIAAFLVFLFHISTSGLFTSARVNHDVQFAVSRAGDLGVSFFFVLSGFVLAWSARPDDTRRAFWRRRAAKVLPNHFATWALAIALMLATGIAPSPFETIPDLASVHHFLPSLASLLLVQSWIPDLGYAVSGNPVSWTLACELLFYLSFPWLFAAISRIRPGRLWAWALGTVAVVFAVPFAAAHLLPGHPALAWNPAVSNWHHYAVSSFPPVRLLEFVLGILMARIVLSGRWIQIGLLPATLLLVGGYVAALNVPYLYGVTAVTALPLALLVAAAAAGDAAQRPGVLSGRTMVWLGEISFAFYMVHIGVIAYGRQLIGPTRTFSVPAGIAVMAACCAVATLLAWALYRAVEQPAMRRFGRAGRRAAPAGNRSA